MDLDSHKQCGGASCPVWGVLTGELRFSLLLIRRKKLGCALPRFLLLSRNAQLGLWVIITNVANNRDPDLRPPELTSQLRLMGHIFGAPVSPLPNGDISVFIMK